MGKNGKRIDAANVNAFVVGVGRPTKPSKKADEQPVDDPAPAVEVKDVAKPVEAAKKAAKPA